MYLPDNRPASRRSPAALRACAALGASLLAACSGGDHLLGNIKPEPVTIQPDDASATRQDASNACVATEYPGREVALDPAFYLTVDRSGSMVDPKWDAFASGLTRFLHSDDANGSSIGIHYFPFTPNLEACGRCRPNDCGCLNDCGCPCDQRNEPRNCQRPVWCDANVYERPAVEIGPMPQNGGALAMSPFQQGPFGPTTIRPALRGALDHLGWYAGSHPNDHLVELLVVGGPPAPDCAPSSINDTAEVAGSSNFRTHVITFDYDGPAVDPIAQRGGGKVFRIDSRRDDIARRFAGIVDELRREPHCEYELPPVNIDYTKVGVEVNLSPDAGWGPAMKLQVYWVKNREACGNGATGWHYDRSEHPTRVVMCADTCRMIHGPTELSVAIKIGCSTPRPPN